MPWFPEFFSAVELARRQDRSEGMTDPVGQYFAALQNGDTHVLETAWPGRVTVYDPRAGEIHGHRQLRRFIRHNEAFLAERGAHVEKVAQTCIPGRAVVELLVRLSTDGRQTRWPVAVVAESFDDSSVVFRTYCSRYPVDGRRFVRPSILQPRPAHLGGVVGRYLTALEAGDIEGAVGAFTPDGYVRESYGPSSNHRGTNELHSYFTRIFADGGVGTESCVVTEDATRCAIEYNYLRWGSQELPAQAGLAVYERGADGLLTAARLYDDIEPPAEPFPDGAAPGSGRSAARPDEDPAERALFDTMAATYPLALEPEQHAMIKQLRTRMPTIPAQERTSLIDDIENSIGQNLEEELEL